MINLNEVVEWVRRHPQDNGSPEVQIALLCAEITNLQQHVWINRHDVAPKRALLKKVARRRWLMKYLKTQNLETYQRVADMFKLKV